MGKYNISTELYSTFAPNNLNMRYSYSAPNIQSLILRWPYLLMVIVAIAFLSGALLYTLFGEYHFLLAALQTADAHAMVLLNFNGGALTDRFFYGYSQMRTWLPLAVVLVGYTLVWHQGSWRDRLLLLLVIAAMIAFTDQLSSGIIKPIVARPRPSHNLTLAPMLHYVNGYHGGQYGFVSGHATNISCLVTFLCSFCHHHLLFPYLSRRTLSWRHSLRGSHRRFGGSHCHLFMSCTPVATLRPYAVGRGCRLDGHDGVSVGGVRKP